MASLRYLSYNYNTAVRPGLLIGAVQTDYDGMQYGIEAKISTAIAIEIEELSYRFSMHGPRDNSGHGPFYRRATA